MENHTEIEERLEAAIEEKLNGTWEVHSYGKDTCRVDGYAVGQEIARFIHMVGDIDGLKVSYVQGTKNSDKVTGVSMTVTREE